MPWGLAYASGLVRLLPGGWSWNWHLGVTLQTSCPEAQRPGQVGVTGFLPVCGEVTLHTCISPGFANGATENCARTFLET